MASMQGGFRLARSEEEEEVEEEEEEVRSSRTLPRRGGRQGGQLSHRPYGRRRKANKLKLFDLVANSWLF